MGGSADGAENSGMNQSFFYLPILMSLALGLLLSLVASKAILPWVPAIEIGSHIDRIPIFSGYSFRVRVNQNYGNWWVMSSLLVALTLVSFYCILITFKNRHSSALKFGDFHLAGGAEIQGYTIISAIIFIYILVDAVTPFFLSNPADPRLWLSIGAGQYISYFVLLSLMLFLISAVYWHNAIRKHQKLRG